MPKVFRPSNRESKILSKIESSIGHERKRAINAAKDHADKLSNAVAMKLIENNLVETTNKNGLEAQVLQCLEKLTRADDFDIDYKVAPFRNIAAHPNVVSAYLTAFVIEDLISHKDTVDIYGSDEEIYGCIHRQVSKVLS